MICHLCGTGDCTLVESDEYREYYRCNVCELVFVPKQFHLTYNQEADRYSLHDNTSDNLEYIKYLNNFAKILEFVNIKYPKILDFGAGRYTVLEKILTARNISCSSYDPLYNIGTNKLKNSYDVVILCEVIEHLRNLKLEINLINRLINNTGYLIIRTQFYSKENKFSSWWYAKDLTHINFFNEVTITKIADILNCKIIMINKKNTVLLKRN